MVHRFASERTRSLKLNDPQASKLSVNSPTEGQVTALTLTLKGIGASIFKNNSPFKRSIRYRVPSVGSATDLCWMDKDCVVLGKRLKEIRIAKGYRIAEHFALSNGIARSQYDRYEKGGNITFVTLCRVLRRLDVTLEELFCEGF